MANGLPYYKAYPRDFIEGTIGMPFEIKCAYRVVIDLIYMQGGKLPDDARYISGLLGCSIRKWSSLRDALILADKIQVSGEFLSNYRADKELETLAKLQDIQRQNASGPRKNKDLQKPPHRQPEPEPELDSKREAKASPKNGSRLPKDWFLPASWGQWAVAEGVSQEVARAEADRFKDYWVGLAGAKARKADWEATWRNWIRKAIADAKPKLTAITGGQNVKPNKEQQRLDAFIRGARNTS